MSDPGHEEPAVGVELQIIEVANELEWAEAQGREDDVARLREQLEGLYTELARSAEVPIDEDAAAEVKLIED